MKQFVRVRAMVMLAVFGAGIAGLLVWLYSWPYWAGALIWIPWMAFLLWVFHEDEGDRIK
jgi:hypothetical protein